MQTLFKKVVASIAVLAFASTAFAASTNDSPSYNTLYVTDQKLSSNSWSSSVTVNEGETISFDLHYFLEEGISATDMRFSLEDLDGRSFNAGSNETVTASVMADNLSTANGSVTLNFADDVKLEVSYVSWQKQSCTSTGCEETLVDNYMNVFTSSGMTIGNVSGSNSDYYGNVIVGLRAVNNGGGGNGGDDVDVTTNSASSIDEDSAKLNGEMDGDDNIDVWFAFEEGDSTPSCSDSSQEEGTDNIDDGQSFSHNVTGLDDDTTYYFRACAEEDNGDIVSGSIRSFTTDDDDDGNNNNDEDITTNSASNVDEDSARLNGEWEGEDNTEVWFAFDEDDSTPSCNSSSQEEGNTNVDDNEDFSETVHGLDRNEKYYFRACAYDEDNDIISGSIRSFTTDDDEDDDDDEDVDVTTDSATNVDEDSAKLNGEVEGDDNVEVWFAISRTDSTPSCSVSSQTISVSGSYDDGDDFSKTVTNLRENEKYYFRACAEDTDGDTVSGSIRTFVTDDEGGNGGGDDDASTITNIASGVGTNSATLNSLVFGDGNATCYFQYGRTTAFGASSPAVFVNLDTSNRCSSTRFGLSSGTTYYYRSVLVADGETHYGLTRSFRTNTTFVPPVTPPVNPPVIVIEEEGELDVMKWVSSETDPEFDPEEVRARRGETVFYKVRVKNNTGETLENITLIDRIPYYLELDTRASLDDDADKQVRWTIESLRDGKSRTFITEMRVREDAFVGDEIESYATAFNDEININSNDVIIDVRSGSLAGDDEEITDEDDNTQGASIFNIGFFPTSLVGWLVLLLVIFAIAYFLSRIFFTRNENQKVIEELRAMEAARING